MIYIDNPITDPAYNLALEEHLVINGVDDVFMLWQNEPAVIIGRNQYTDNQVDRAYAQEHHIAVHRRLSGGGAVYHDAGNLNFTIILREGAHRKNDFTFFTRPIVEVLRSYGINARFSGRNDLTVEGKKFSGNAQYNQGTTLLHHGTLLWDSDLTVLSQVLKPKQRVVAREVDSHSARVTNLASYAPEGLTLAQFKSDLLKQMSAAGFSAQEQPSDSLLLVVSASLVEKYRSDIWNWGAGPSAEDVADSMAFPASC